MATTIEELEAWMQVPKESEGLEFKAARSQFSGDKVMDYCVGIANDLGGKLILGVTDKPPRKVVGTPAVGDTQDMQKKILDKLHFEVKIEEVMHPDGRVVICHIPSRPPCTPLNHDGRFWMRSGEELRAMSPDRLRLIIEEGKPDWLLRSARDGCSELDVLSVLDTHAFFDRLNQVYPSTTEHILQVLEDEKLIIRNRTDFSITNLGAIMFAPFLSDFEGLARKAPRVLIYKGTDKLEKAGEDFPGKKGYVLGFEPLVDFINRHIPSNQVIGKAFRTEVRMFPEEAIRELVANALIHQDFNESGTSVTIEIYSNRLEISNPGTPIIPPDRFADGVQSRNESLAGLARRLGMCEEQGLGIDRVLKSTEVYQLPAPSFRQGARRMTVVMFAQKRFAEMDRQERINACFWHCVLRYVTREQMNNESLRARFDLSESQSHAVSVIIADTKNANKIKLDNPANPSTRYAKYVPYWA